jgi:ABC-type transport system involved in multi-copper enzyme maturation permease subunit
MSGLARAASMGGWRVAAIALHAFKESVRDRILYALLAFALAMIGASAILSGLSVGGEVKIIKDLGLAACSAVGTLIAVFVGIGLVHKEIERRSIVFLMAKPVRRGEVILGKFGGLALTLLVNVAVMAGALASLARWLEGGWSPELLVAVGLIYVQLLILTAIALFFSTFSTPTLSAIFTLALAMIGHMSGDLRAFAASVGGPGLRLTIEALYHVLPNFAALDVKAAAARGSLPPAAEVAGGSLYGAAYVAALLAAAILVFGRRDFK